MSDLPTAPARRSRIGAPALLAAALLAGCGSAGPAPVAATATPPSADPDALLAGLVAQGGMCAGGPCRTELTVLRDGRWRATRAAEEPERTGTLEGARLAELREAVAGTTLGGAPPFTGTCPTAYDGQEIVVTWAEAGETRSASSCEVEFPPADPLPASLRSLLASIDRPAG